MWYLVFSSIKVRWHFLSAHFTLILTRPVHPSSACVGGAASRPPPASRALRDSDSDCVLCMCVVRRVTGNRPRWWYVALANCQTNYLTLTNLELQFHNQGLSIWTKHFSADVAGVYPACVFYYVVSVIALVGLYWTKRIAKIRRRHHEALKSILWCVWFEHLSLLFQLFHYATFARNGIGYPTLLDWAFFWNLFSTLSLLQIILDISKGAHPIT